MVTTMNPEVDEIVRRVVARVKDELVTPEWLTPAQAGAYCGMTARSLEDLRYRKQGPAFSKVGERIVRYRRADIDAWLLSGGTA
jgi:predicted DNA-binding transcriptional regulator AlpA